MIVETRDELVMKLNTQPYIPGVLILENGKTYGRTANKKRLLYKCVPNNRRFPSFLVPYEITLGFSKMILNKYVLFRFESWTMERPHGLLVEVLGNVSNKDAYVEYQLYCRNLRYTIAPFIRIMRDAVRDSSIDQIIRGIQTTELYNMSPPSSSVHIFTIDPDFSTDLDDGFSISRHPENGNTVVSVYIANVFVWMDYFGIWSSFSDRVSTIYLPDRKIPLLPPILSDTLCSLLENEPRFAVVMDIEITPLGDVLRDTAVFRNQQICVSKNYRYESKELLRDSDYTELLRISKLADPTIRDSHDVVAFWMIHTNAICGAELYKKRRGIFRIETNTNETSLHPEFDETTARFLRNWKHTSCTYRPYDETTTNYYHSGINMDTYAHITSPIRRLVDILNQTMFLHSMGIISGIRLDAIDFCERWVSKIEQVNTDMKSIRKLQSDCELLYLYQKNPAVLTNVYSGIVLEKQLRPSSAFLYTIYLVELQKVARVYTLHDYTELTQCMCRLVWFTDEDNIRDKIRLQIVEP